MENSLPAPGFVIYGIKPGLERDIYDYYYFCTLRDRQTRSNSSRASFNSSIGFRGPRLGLQHSMTIGNCDRERDRQRGRRAGSRRGGIPAG